MSKYVYLLISQWLLFTIIMVPTFVGICRLWWWKWTTFFLSLYWRLRWDHWWLKKMWYIIITEQRANVASFKQCYMHGYSITISKATLQQKFSCFQLTNIFLNLVSFFKTQLKTTYLLIYGPDVFLPQWWNLP